MNTGRETRETATHIGEVGEAFMITSGNVAKDVVITSGDVAKDVVITSLRQVDGVIENATVRATHAG